jgi:hypothetical protein
MAFSSVYPLCVKKAERKGRTQAEVDETIRWLTGCSETGQDKLIDELARGKAMEKILRR